jgi:hypothetical protein
VIYKSISRDGRELARKRYGSGGGLYANIHAKQERIKHGSGEKMRKPGAPGAPTAKAFEQAAKTRLDKKRRKRQDGGGLLERGNVDLKSRPMVYNPDGTISTVRSMNFGEDGAEVLVPTVRKDPFHPMGGYIMSPDDAISHYRKTGEHLGKFSSPEAAEAYARNLHEEQAKQYRRASGGRTPAWQRAEGKNPEGGLNEKGRRSYHQETGGTLKRPQPEGGKRRDSFCARMKGAKKKLTSAETARDPNSRINKSLRAWNC